MAKTKKTHDIFLSYPFDLGAQAEKVAEAFEKAGLAVFAVPEAEPGQDVLQEMWQALAESWAVVALVKPKTMPPAVAVEIGAAAAWHKPIYILIDGEVSGSIPFDISQCSTFPISRIDTVLQLILKSRSPLNEEETEVLVKAYVEIGIPTDQLLMEPASMDRLNRMIWKQSELKLSGERMMQELLRLRKKGKLPRVRRTR